MALYNRQMRRISGKNMKRNWICPNCDHHHEQRFTQGKKLPYLMCDNCDHFFTMNDTPADHLMYPNGLPDGFETKGGKLYE